jgi:hypothetical protein
LVLAFCLPVADEQRVSVAAAAFVVDGGGLDKVAVEPAEVPAGALVRDVEPALERADRL